MNSKITPASPLAISLEYEKLNSMPSCPSCGEYAEADIMLIASMAEALIKLKMLDPICSLPIHTLVTLAEARVAEINKYREPDTEPAERTDLVGLPLWEVSAILGKEASAARERLAKESLMGES